MLNYHARLAKARARMAQENVALMYLTCGANLFYLTGLQRQEEGGTDHNRYGDWVTGGYIGLEGGVDLVAARMGGSFFEDQVSDKPWFNPPRLILESEDPLAVLKEILSRFDLRGAKVALDDRAWAQTVLALRRLLPGVEFVLASSIVAPLRMIKSQAELDLLRQAGQVTDAVFQKALAVLKPGVSELDVAHEINYQFKLQGAQYVSFVTGIYFSNPTHDRDVTAVQTDRRTLQPGNSVMFDLGCVYQGYCSDFGRTAFVGQPPGGYLKLHDLVLEAQRAAMEAMKAGQITAAEANAAARAVIEEAGYGPNFIHRLGHGIGVTVHEPPYLDVTDHSLLQANMTFTVEPSILSVKENPLPGNLGNRVEDVVQVTQGGAVSLYPTDRRLYVVD
jgi:Xaa-Pro aminopeptidase